jgi:hypothetical protein
MHTDRITAMAKRPTSATPSTSRARNPITLELAAAVCPTEAIAATRLRAGGLQPGLHGVGRRFGMLSFGCLVREIMYCGRGLNMWDGWEGRVAACRRFLCCRKSELHLLSRSGTGDVAARYRCLWRRRGLRRSNRPAPRAALRSQVATHSASIRVICARRRAMAFCKQS